MYKIGFVYNIDLISPITSPSDQLQYSRPSLTFQTSLLVKTESNHMHITLTLLLYLFILTDSDSTTLLLSPLQLTQKQILRFRQNLNGRTLTGEWQCIEELFYQPAECTYFRIPRDPNIQINNEVLYEPETFFSFTNQGYIEGFFYSSNGESFSDRLYLLLFRDSYRSKQVMEMDLNLVQAEKFEFEPEKNQTKVVAFKHDNLIATVSLYEQQVEIVKYDLAVSVEVFIQKESFNLFQSSNKQKIETPIKIRVFSQSITFGTSVKSPSHKAIVNTLLLLALLQVIFIFLNPSTSKQNVSKTRSIMFRISQWFILQMYAFIFILSKEYIKLGMKYFDTELGTLIYVGLGNIGLGMLFLRKYEMVLEKFINWKMMVMAVGFVLGYGLLAGEFLDEPAFWVVEVTLMLQLQFVHSMMSGGKGGLPYDLIGFMMVSRLPLIYMLMDDNVFRTQPASKSYIIFLGLTFITNITLIFLQSLKGGQFLVLNEIIPGYYNYYFTDSVNEKKLQEQCPICTSPLNKSPDQTLEMTEVEGSSIHSIQSSESREVTEDNRSKTDELITKTVRYMKTPCNHLFHIQCLTRWMQSKLVCPYCRTTLPQLASMQKE